MTAITIQGRNCSAGMKPILACLPRILLTEMKSLSGSLSMVIRGEWGSGRVGEGESGRVGEGIIESGVKKLEFEMNRKPIQSHRDLEVYQLALDVAMQIFELSKKFPVEERYSLTDQIRRSSRSVCANLSEAWRKRRYEGAFVSKLSDSEAEAAETQTWIEFAVRCNYLDVQVGRELYQHYNQILGTLVNMINNPSMWLLPVSKNHTKSR